MGAREEWTKCLLARSDYVLTRLGSSHSSVSAWMPSQSINWECSGSMYRDARANEQVLNGYRRMTYDQPRASRLLLGEAKDHTCQNLAYRVFYQRSMLPRSRRR